ncbi:hypothetical protein [Micromonospora sp. CPCC 206061]|uniref:hypothetical protein n=1 Tax=Micromonospora sp. CPCC 206061 TaxID=3122410 RepID=UPI002FEE8B4E
MTSTRSEGPSDTAVTIGAQAVAAFADEYQVQLPPELREDLARSVLTAAWPHLASSVRATSRNGI